MVLRKRFQGSAEGLQKQQAYKTTSSIAVQAHRGRITLGVPDCLGDESEAPQ